MRNQDSPTPPTLMEIRQARSRLGRLVVETPVWQWRSDEMKLAVEPAGAAATAALCGPLRERLSGKRVGIIDCGTNIDRESFCRFISTGEQREN